MRTEGPRTACVPRSGDRPGTDWAPSQPAVTQNQDLGRVSGGLGQPLCAPTLLVHLRGTGGGSRTLLGWRCEGAGHHRAGVPCAARPCPAWCPADRHTLFPSRSSGVETMRQSRLCRDLHSAELLSVTADSVHRAGGHPAMSSSPLSGTEGTKGRARGGRERSSCRDVGTPSGQSPWPPSRGPVRGRAFHVWSPSRPGAGAPSGEEWKMMKAETPAST